MLPKAPLADCETCPLKNEPHVLGSGPEHPKYVIVGEAPGRDEIKSGVPFIGRSGQLLNKVLAHHGIERSEVYVTNTVLCRPPGNRTPTAVEIRHCKERLFAEIKAHAPTAVLALGAPASKTLLGSKQGITGLRIGGAKLSDNLGGIPVVATFHPAAALRSPDRFPSIVSDVGKLKHEVNVGWEPTLVAVIDDIHEAIRHLDWQVTHTEDGMVSLDIENSPPFDRHNPDLLSIAISNVRGRASVYTKRIVDNPAWRHAIDNCFDLVPVDWVMQNGKYDTQYLWGAGVRNARVDQDTMLMHYATDERKGTHDLEQLATEYLGAPQYKQLAKVGLEEDESLGDLPLETLYQYNGTDSDVTLRLVYPLRREMESDGTTGPYEELLIPGSAALSAVEYRGIKVDRDMIDKLDERLVIQMKDMEHDLKHWVMNPRSPQQVKKALAEIMGGQELSTTNKDMLNLLIEKDPESEQAEFSRKLLDYRDKQKTLSTYVRGIKARIVDGKVYSSFLLHGTETGRLSSRKPNMQNITQGELRGMFTASHEGGVLLNADYATIELRVAALELGSPWLLQAFREGRSIHKEVARELFGPNYTEYQYRDGKTVTFGIFYDRRAPAIASALRISVGQAQRMIDRWKERCPELDKYFSRIRDEIQANSYLRSRFGRMRRFWLITQDNTLDVFREGYNFPISSAASDINLRSLIRIHKTTTLEPVITVHDSITFDVREASDAEYTQQIVASIMEDTPDFDVPTPVDFKVGYRWQ